MLFGLKNKHFEKRVAVDGEGFSLPEERGKNNPIKKKKKALI